MVPQQRAGARAILRQPDFGGASGAYYKYCAALDKKYKDVDYLAYENPKISRRSVEYCSYILEAIETDIPSG